MLLFIILFYFIWLLFRFTYILFYVKPSAEESQPQMYIIKLFAISFSYAMTPRTLYGRIQVPIMCRRTIRLSSHFFFLFFFIPHSLMLQFFFLYLYWFFFSFKNMETQKQNQIQRQECCDRLSKQRHKICVSFTLTHTHTQNHNRLNMKRRP